MSLRLAVVTFVLFVLACSRHAESFDQWNIPSVLVQPDAPVVVLLNVRIRNTVRRDPGHLFGSSSQSVERSILQTTFQTLDVRTCVAGPVHSYDRSVAQFGWGTAPGELWIQREKDVGAVEVVGGGARLQLGPVPTSRWQQPPFVSVGMIPVPGHLRVWDLARRATRDIPFVPQSPFETILPVRLGDQTIVGLAPDKDHRWLDVVSVPLRAGGAVAPVTTRFQGRFKGAELVHGGSWLVLPSEPPPDGSTHKEDAGLLLVADARTGKVVRRVTYHSKHGWAMPDARWALIDAEGLWFAHLVGGLCGDVEVIDLERDTRAKLPLSGCAEGVWAWSAGGPFLGVTTRDRGMLVDLRSGHTIPVLAATRDRTALLGNVYFQMDDPRAVSARDLVTGERWQTPIGGARSINAVPSARRLVLVDEQRSILVYDLDSRRMSTCM